VPLALRDKSTNEDFQPSTDGDLVKVMSLFVNESKYVLRRVVTYGWSLPR